MVKRRKHNFKLHDNTLYAAHKFYFNLAASPNSNYTEALLKKTRVAFLKTLMKVIYMIIKRELKIKKKEHWLKLHTCNRKSYLGTVFKNKQTVYDHMKNKEQILNTLFEITHLLPTFAKIYIKTPEDYDNKDETLAHKHSHVGVVPSRRLAKEEYISHKVKAEQDARAFEAVMNEIRNPILNDDDFDDEPPDDI